MTTVWEYKVLQWGARAKGEPGEHPLGDRLRKLGSEGWELTGVALLEDPLFSLYVLKRPSRNVWPTACETLVPTSTSAQ